MIMRRRGGGGGEYKFIQNRSVECKRKEPAAFVRIFIAEDKDSCSAYVWGGGV